jgi:hypothetical protein
MIKRDKDLIRSIVGEEIWVKGEWLDASGLRAHWSFENDAKIFVIKEVLSIIGLSYANYGKWPLGDPDLVEKVRDRLTRIMNNDWNSWKAEEF